MCYPPEVSRHRCGHWVIEDAQYACPRSSPSTHDGGFSRGKPLREPCDLLLYELWATSGYECVFQGHKIVIYIYKSPTGCPGPEPRPTPVQAEAKPVHHRTTSAADLGDAPAVAPTGSDDSNDTLGKESRNAVIVTGHDPSGQPQGEATEQSRPSFLSRLKAKLCCF